MGLELTPPTIALRDLTLGYDRHPAVHHLDGEIAPGALLAICGPNGAGKSTLIKSIVGIVNPMGGAVDFGGAREKHGKREKIAYLPQAAQIDLSFPIDVFDMAAMGLWRDIGLFGGLSKLDLQKVREALASVGLNGFERRQIGALSGGQAQRLLFARLMLQDAAVILLDEPFSAIDERTVDDLLGLIARWRGEGRTIVAVLHDFDMVRARFPETLLLAREKIFWGPTEEALSPENLARARKMIEAFDERASACVRAG
ncbi:ABC transporter [Rhodoblastus sphagnicola]|uniref:ABC transporter n=1 Tax=Rhodoblastus sphagnicola TaxID=333368 RepID=A0A2S6NDY8_9HYPH|nr:ABC transporter ATP-binding protein [Rhodoblastus sphagnicola]MBB4198466.1 zinc/manganese transport system ATP-binding protein [Rhodoblastus sphagnicola]PPQ32810.1 ABC transporter [Rhodoblastus sphagnicola]